LHPDTTPAWLERLRSELSQIRIDDGASEEIAPVYVNWAGGNERCLRADDERHSVERAMRKESEIPPADAGRDDFHREIGELVFWFSGIENTIYVLANRLIGSNVVAKVVMCNFHLEKTIDVVRNLARAQHSGSSHLRKFDSALLRFKECAKERNALLHSVAFPEVDVESGAEVIRIMSLRTMKRVRKDRSHIADLREKLSKCSFDFLQAAVDMGVFKERRRRVAVAGRHGVRPTRP
jgi:hypothetical protein